jgi:hypothetical protein
VVNELVQAISPAPGHVFSHPSTSSSNEELVRYIKNTLLLLRTTCIQQSWGEEKSETHHHNIQLNAFCKCGHDEVNCHSSRIWIPLETVGRLNLGRYSGRVQLCAALGIKRSPGVLSKLPKRDKEFKVSGIQSQNS